MINKINKFVGYVCVFLFVTLFFIITLQILSRYLFEEPLIWTEEASKVIFIWICFLGGTVAYYKKSHISIDFLVTRLPDNNKKHIEFFVHGVILFFLVILLVSSYSLVQLGLQLDTVSLDGVNWGHIYFVIPLTSIIMIVYCVNEIFSLMKFKK